MLSVDFNCDIGESTSLWPYAVSKDVSLLPYLSSVNIACGYHAGDAETARTLICEAVARNIAIGAHPSFPDRPNFGRNEMHLNDEALYRILHEQIDFIASIALSSGARLHHVKPHGSLYNMAARDRRLAFTVCSAIQAYDENLIIYGLSGSEIIRVADAIGLRSCNEVFADRTYTDNGSLTPRTELQALIEDEQQSIRQILQMINHGTVCTASGKNISLKAETICVHSDADHSLAFAKAIHETLQHSGINIIHP